MQTIGRYVVEGEAGRGSSGVVFRARDPIIGRTVAIKQIRLDDVADPNERQRIHERLFREAQSAGSLSHPGIVTVYDIQEERGSAFIFMEYVEGQTLELLLPRKQLSPEQIRSILEQTATALDYAHAKGIIHRDIKPANLMVTPQGIVKIMDFGVARMQSQNTTHTGTLLGTPTYMAPEQIQGKPADARADQFSLGVLAYEMLTGNTPYKTDSVPALLFQIVTQPTPPARQFNPSLSATLEAALTRVLSKDPDARFENCSTFVRALSGDFHAVAHQVEQSLPTMAFLPVQIAPDTGPAFVRKQPPAPPEPSPSRFGLFAIILSIASVVALAVAAFTYFGTQPAPVVQAEQLPPLAIPESPKPSPEAVPPPPQESSVEKPEPRKATVVQPTVVEPFDIGVVEYAVRLITAPVGAKIVVDSGSPTCTSPCSLTLPSGRHTFSVSLSGHQSAYRIFQVPDQTELTVTLEKTFGKLSVITTPAGSEIAVDGVVKTERTPAMLTLPSGKHLIRITLAGHDPKEKEIEIHEGDLSEFRITW